MTMTEMQNELRNLGAQIRTAAANLSAAASDHSVTMDELTRMQNDLRDMQQRRDAMQAAFDIQFTGAQGNIAPAATAEDRGLRTMLSSNEYARAFARAVRGGVTRRTGRNDSELKILYDALTIGGGNTVGEDGGFLVPEDIDHQIRELQRQMNPLSQLFNVEQVMTDSGWRVIDTAPTTGMTDLDEMESITPGDQPIFGKVTYKLTKYGLIVPVSSELASDEIANLFAYLARWFAKKSTITENGLLLEALEDLTPTPVETNGLLRGIKSALNVSLDPMIALNAAILTNQTGFDMLDSLTDKLGRPLLMRDPMSDKPMMPGGKPIHVMSDAQLPNGDDDAAPMYIGDFKQYATLFERNPLEVVSTDIGGNSFRTASIETRGIKRMGVSVFDNEAAVALSITQSEDDDGNIIVVPGGTVTP